MLQRLNLAVTDNNNYTISLNTDCFVPSFPCHFREKYLLENSGSGISEHPGFKILWGGMPPDPPSISHLRRSIPQPPTFVMLPVTSKLTESTACVREDSIKKTKQMANRRLYILFKIFWQVLTAMNSKSRISCLENC